LEEIARKKIDKMFGIDRQSKWLLYK
jgi:hypothetical protein